MRYAVNLYDWIPFWKDPLSGPALLLQPNLVREVVQCVKDRMDEDAVLVRPDMPAEQWAAMVKIIRESWGMHRNKYRLYQSRTGKGGWERL